MLLIHITFEKLYQTDDSFRPKQESYRYTEDGELVVFNATIPQKIYLLGKEFSLLANSVMDFLKVNQELSANMIFDDDITDLKNIALLREAYESRNEVLSSFHNIVFYLFGGKEAEEF